MKTKNFSTILIFILTLSALSFSLFFLNTSYGSEKNESVYEKIEKKERITYLVIGDSIGRGSGAETPNGRWFKQLEKKMSQQHGVSMKGDFLVQSGATSLEGLYKLQNERIMDQVNLIFIVFGENDRKYMNERDFGILYESLIRQSKAKYPAAEIITITESCLTFEDFANKIQDLSSHYGASNADMRPVFKNSGKSNQELTRDNVHPNGQGYSLYSDTLYHLLKNNKKNNKTIAQLNKPISPEARELKLKVNSRYRQQNGLYPKNGYLTSKKAGSSAEYEFTGNLVGVKLLRGPDGGYVNVYVDNIFVAKMNTWWPFKRERIQYIANGLSDGPHTVRFEVTGEKPSANKSRDAYFRVSSILSGSYEK
ncbi:lysophospholipase L1-like esterase [Peribacillus deserti]|uniref:Lysophospholipase L1-like esterase n=1 Tax=Peribacillus deserti TaxID=673318 RepID=A0ABS2QJR3_9BACI|nr:SGNH/GDSL hydrolase family protein [Peribacillus deserti]MBM7692531.1 lysophospholipase L1-like esterase [Peribacillus deserti]